MEDSVEFAVVLTGTGLHGSPVSTILAFLNERLICLDARCGSR